MIGCLPESLNVNGTEYEINTDYRIALLIMEALDDPDLTDDEKAVVLLCNLFCKVPEADDYAEAFKQAAWFLDGGVEYETPKASDKKVIDWSQDERYIFSAVNKVAGQEIRNLKFLHWWTFLGYLSEIDEGMLTTIMNIRRKKNTGKKLDKTEQEFYKNNRAVIDIKPKLSKEEQKQKEEIKKLLGFC